MLQITTNQIAYNRFLEERRNNIASLTESQRHSKAVEAETHRSNLMNETNARNTLIENIRAHKASEANTRYVADRNYASSIYSADAHASASRYAADRSASASIYSADASERASRYSSDTNASNALVSSAATRYSADQHLKGTVGSATVSTLGNTAGKLLTGLLLPIGGKKK